MSTTPAYEPKQLVMVGRRWSAGEAVDYSVWDKPYDEVIEAITKRAGDYKPGVYFEVVEVTMHRRTVITSEVTVTPHNDPSEPSP